MEILKDIYEYQKPYKIWGKKSTNQIFVEMKKTATSNLNELLCKLTIHSSIQPKGQNS